MPSLREHEKRCITCLGKPYTEVHKWMDEPSKWLGGKHRKERHDLEKTPKDAKELFGEGADLACLNHIKEDLQEMKKGLNHPVISIRTSMELLDLINIYVAYNGKSRSEILNKMIVEFLFKEAPYLMFKQSEIYMSREERNPFETRTCEKCKAIKPVKTFHIDGNIENNEKNNVIALCDICSNSFIKYRNKYKWEQCFYEWFFNEEVFWWIEENKKTEKEKIERKREEKKLEEELREKAKKTQFLLDEAKKHNWKLE